MSITREQVADLRPGDVVELRNSRRWPEGTAVRGPLYASGDGLLNVAHLTVRYSDGRPLGWLVDNTGAWSLTVVSRAPRPLYVNHDRTVPVPGDVARDAENDSDRCIWLCRDTDDECWYGPIPAGAKDCEDWRLRSELPTRLRLLVDGATGQAVTS